MDLDEALAKVIIPAVCRLVNRELADAVSALNLRIDELEDRLDEIERRAQAAKFQRIGVGQ